MCVCVFTQPVVMDRMWPKVNFRRIIAGFNSEFWFPFLKQRTQSTLPFALSRKRTGEFIPISRSLAWSEMQTASSRISIRFADSISYDDSCYINLPSHIYVMLSYIHNQNLKSVFVISFAQFTRNSVSGSYRSGICIPWKGVRPPKSLGYETRLYLIMILHFWSVMKCILLLLLLPALLTREMVVPVSGPSLGQIDLLKLLVRNTWYHFICMKNSYLKQ